MSVRLAEVLMRASTLVLAGGVLAGAGNAQNSPLTRPAHLEVPGDAPAAPTAQLRSAPGPVLLGSFSSIQVNVDSLSNNIVGDAANEPSICVDPTNPQRMAIGWRQFDTTVSNFRQAGWAYSHDGGQTWTFPGVIEPGIFRSDPVLESDINGVFYYYSLTTVGPAFLCDVFKSTDGGVSWDAGVSAFGGDKNWMAIDRSNDIGQGNVYGIWQRFANCCNEDTLTRSVDQGGSFQFPVEIPDSPTFGVVEVGSNGDVYAAGIQANSQVGQNFNQFIVSRSTDAEDAGQTPSFTTVLVDLGGSMGITTGPNPAGLLGQAYVRTDPTDNNRVFTLCSVNPSGTDPLDVHFIRSEDGGATWTPPLRINDDPPSSTSYQWLATLSVAPNGRLDVVWADTRNGGGQVNLSELFYTYSFDGGNTWLEQQAASPQFDSFLGWPNQNKMGDYFDMVSDEHGADLAYAATFNGEQDVYYLRLFPDCNDNGISDELDIQGGGSTDADGDHIPDDCESLTLSAAPLNPAPLQQLRLEVDNGLPFTPGLLYLTAVDGVPVNTKVGNITFNASGKAQLQSVVPFDPNISNKDFTLVAFALFLDGSIQASNSVVISVQ